MLTHAINLTIAFVLIAIILYTVEALFPADPDKPTWRKDSGLDLAYWFFTSIITKALTKIAVLSAVVFAAVLAGRHISPAIAEGLPPISTQPRLLIVFEILLCGDLLAYWLHRAFHKRALWKYHAVHHSSTRVDWLSALRLHPVNDLVMRFLQIMPFVILGFPLNLLAGYIPFISLYAIFLHANVNWSFGPLKYVIATPVFHRWHHSAESSAVNKNFAGLFPVWDIIFGTFYMPEGAAPTKFGAVGAKVPETLLGQLLYPFRRASSLRRI